ncbi:MAG: heme-binding domain-containing protein [Saprospiraceae bacterium]|nr:heme-binding domain-containing protein [Saprospiraceae bacterium]MDW8228333.1 heme-binding domain-containing protein [Saprospiraceae bacterium]
MRLKHLLLGFLGLFILIQFIRPDKSAPTFASKQDISAVLETPAEVGAMLKAACYDCHSYQTRYPWYAEIAPVSWWLANHISEGREHVNFSTFGAMPTGERLEVLAECSEVVLDGEMPLRSYTWMHPEARLSAEQRRLLAEWFSTHANWEGGPEGEEEDKY